MINPLHKVWVGTFISTLVVLAVVSISKNANALATQNSCAKVEVIFARGSGRDLAEGDKNRESKTFHEQLSKRISRALYMNYYELGTDPYGGYQYGAVDITSVSHAFDALGTLISAGNDSVYQHSVIGGILELQSYISQRYKKCQSVSPYFIIGGYSQGAQVIGEALLGIPKEIRNRIVFTGLFGDPKLYFPEGKGNNPPACQGKGQNISKYRKGFNQNYCHLWQGRLQARTNYLYNDMVGKTGVWCNNDDFICGTSNYLFAPGHDKYPDTNGPIDAAAQEAAKKLQTAIANEPHSSPTPTSSPSPSPTPSSSPTPTPEPHQDQLIDTSYHLGQGTSGQNIEFLIDMQGSMQPKFASIAASIRRSINHLDISPDALYWKDYRDLAGINFYAGQGTGPIINGTYQPSWGGLDFTQLISYKHQYLDILPYTSFHPLIGSPLYAIERSLQAEPWRTGATKSIILFTDKLTYPSPDYYGLTTESIAKHALEIDPVNIYPVVPIEAAGAFAELAQKTSGQVVTYDGDNLEAAADLAFAKIQQRPVPFLKLSQYIANPGQEITFDASDSYVINSTITKYDWDFDGDGSFDATTPTPSINHTYGSQFDGTMQVRVTAANGLIANASAIIKVGTYTPPTLPKTPRNLKVTILTTENNISTVRLTWDPVDDPLTSQLVLSVNGVMLGTMTPDRTSIDITDVDRSIDTDFSIAGMMDDNTIGEAGIVTLAAPVTPTTSVQANIDTAASKSIANSTLIEGDTPVLSREVNPYMQLDTLRRTFSTSPEHTSSSNSSSLLTNMYVWAGIVVLLLSGGWVLVRRMRGVH